jgi:hypothetical protein
MSDIDRKVLENDLVSTIVDDSDFSWPWYRLCWKSYLLSFPCKWRTSKPEIVHVMCTKLKTRWSWTSSWTQNQSLQFWIGLDLHLGICISLAPTASWCPRCPPWSTPWSHRSERRKGCTKMETCLVVATWRKRPRNANYSRQGGISQEYKK